MLDALGATYRPNKYWAVAVPTWACVAFFTAAIGYELWCLATLDEGRVGECFEDVPEREGWDAEEEEEGEGQGETDDDESRLAGEAPLENAVLEGGLEPPREVPFEVAIKALRNGAYRRAVGRQKRGESKKDA